MPLAASIAFERRAARRQPLVSASVDAGFLSPTEDYHERSIEEGEDQKLTIRGVVTLVIH
jgi:hypothetical protein